MNSTKNIVSMHLPNGKKECARNLVASVQLPPVAISYLKATSNPGTADTVKAFAELSGKFLSCRYRLKASGNEPSVIATTLHDNQMGILIAIIKWLIKQGALNGIVLAGFEKINKLAIHRALRCVLSEVMNEDGAALNTDYTETLKTYGWTEDIDFNRHKRFYPVELLKVDESSQEPYSREALSLKVGYVSQVAVNLSKHGKFTILTTNLPYKKLLEMYEEVPVSRVKNEFLRIILKKDTEF